MSPPPDAPGPLAAAGQIGAAPDECIDCGVCVPECPVDAIIDEADATGDQVQFIELNRELSALWPMINRKAEPAADADQWKEVGDKLHLLER